MRIKLWLAIVFFWGMVSGCVGGTSPTLTQRPSTPTPTLPSLPTRAPLVVLYLPEDLLPLRPALRACAQAEGIAPAFLVGLQDALPSQVDLAFWWGQPPSSGAWQAYPIGQERLAVVAASGRPHRLTTTAVRRMVLGQTTTWPGEVPLALWLPAPGSGGHRRLRAWLGEARLRGDAAWAPSPTAMLQVLRHDQAALGFVPAAWLRYDATARKDIQQIALADGFPSSWQAPVLALLPSQPSPWAENLVACLQQGRGRALLAPYHEPP